MTTKMLTLVKQPEGSYFCGQAVVATACGVSIEIATGWCGKRGLTGTRHLKRALEERFTVDSLIVLPPLVRKYLHIQLSDDLASWMGRLNEHLPRRCVFRLRKKDQRISHWVLLWDKHLYDPDTGIDILPPLQTYPSSYMKLGNR